MSQLATLCYVRRDGQTLMLYRNRRPDDVHAGKWNGLGGKFEAGETPEQCVAREVEEESGLRIEDPQLKGFISFPRFRDNEDWYVFVFLADRFSGRLRQCSEGDLQWVDNDRLLALSLWPGDRIFLPWLAQSQFFSASFVYEAGRLVEHQAMFY